MLTEGEVPARWAPQMLLFKTKNCATLLRILSWWRHREMAMWWRWYNTARVRMWRNQLSGWLSRNMHQKNEEKQIEILWLLSWQPKHALSSNIHSLSCTQKRKQKKRNQTWKVAHSNRIFVVKKIDQLIKKISHLYVTYYVINYVIIAHLYNLASFLSSVFFSFPIKQITWQAELQLCKWATDVIVARAPPRKLLHMNLTFSSRHIIIFLLFFST